MEAASSSACWAGDSDFQCAVMALSMARSQGTFFRLAAALLGFLASPSKLGFLAAAAARLCDETLGRAWPSGFLIADTSQAAGSSIGSPFSSRIDASPGFRSADGFSPRMVATSCWATFADAAVLDEFLEG